MVENNLFPIRCGVAGRACLAEGPFVYVIFSMAGQAFRWCLPIFDLGFVAGLALGFLGVGVGPCEGKVRLGVVEGGFVDWRNVLFSPLVVGMALAAFPLLFQPAMKALLAFDILADVFMAVLAQLSLRRLIESLVAFGAGFLPFRVPLNDLARHEGGFKRVGKCRSWKETREEEGGEEKRLVAKVAHEHRPSHHRSREMVLLVSGRNPRTGPGYRIACGRPGDGHFAADPESLEEPGASDNGSIGSDKPDIRNA